jgi:hypothetical protein
MAEEGESYSTAPSQENLPETTIWSYDFSSGIPSTWGNTGFYNYAGTGTGTIWSAPFEYRGPTTTPSSNNGSRGGYAGSQLPILSTTQSNGFVIFDSDYRNNGGLATDACQTSTCGLHYATLTTPSINLSGHSQVDLNFAQYYRRFKGTNNDWSNGPTYIDFSVNNGLTWFGGLPINDHIGGNVSTSRSNQVSIPIGAYVGGYSNVRIRFRFEGLFYFWMLDDISLTTTPSQRISFFGKEGGLNPEVLLSFTQGQISNGGYPVGQARPLAVDANVWNSGSTTLSNVRLVALVIRPNGQKDSLYSATVPTLVPNDSVHLGAVFPNWVPTTGQIHKVVFVARTNSARWTYPDTLVIDNSSTNLASSFASRRPQKFIGAAISTSYMGDGAEVWTGFYINHPDTVFNIEVHLASLSRPGSMLECMLMDSTEFELGNNNIIDFKQYYITASDSTNRIARIPFCSPHLLPKGRYYVKVTLYKVNANGYIGIFNDISNLQHIGSNWFRTAGSSNRFNRYSNSIQFNTPKLTLGFSKFSNQVFPTANDLKLTINGDSVLCAGQSRTLTAPLGYSYLWSNGATTQSISVNSTAYYSCSLSNTSCSFSSNTIHLRLHAPNAFSIAAQPSTTFCQGDSTRLFVPFNPTTLYSWSNGKTTNAQYVKAGGTYTLTRVDSLGCTKSSSITTTMLSVPPIQITTSGPLSFCPGGSVTLYATAGGSSYLWSTGATSQTITVNATGSYGVSMGLINGCTSRATPVQVVSAAPPASVIASGPLNFCPGESVTLSAPAGYSYLWSNGATTQSITTSAAGSYTVTVSQNGCSSTSAAQVVAVGSSPPATVTASGPATFCQGGSVTLSAPAGYTYLWSNGSTAQSITPTSTGSYSVTVTANGCSSTSAAQAVVVNPVPPSTVSASGPLTFCQGGSVSLSAPAGYSYLWSNGATTQSISPTASGSYTVTVSANGCSSTSAAQAVTVNAIPPSTVSASGSLSLCQGGSVTLSAPAGYAYLWSNGATTQSITASTAGSYSVTVSANGCSSTSAAQAVTVSPLPPSTVSASGPLTFCQGGSVSLSAPAGYTYLWSNGATTQSITAFAAGSYSVTVSANGCSSTSAAQAVVVNPLPSSAVSVSGSLTFCQGSSVTLSAPAGYSYLWSNGATTQSITASTAGSYSVTVSANGCSSTSAAQAVVVNPVPSSTVSASGPLTFCQGGSVTLSAPAGYSYLWSNGATTQSISPTASGSYTVTVSANGCSSTSAAQAVVVNPLPSSAVSVSGSLTFCQGSSVTLSAPAGYSYLWSNGATTQSITASTAGSYSVTVSANGCSSTSAAQAVVVNPVPLSTVSASGPLTFCQGGSVSLSAPAGYTYLWSSGATTQSITAFAAGSYSVTVTANGCSSTSAALAVTVNPNPPANVVASGPLTFCQGGSVTLVAPSGYAYVWSNGATTQTINAAASGSYTVTVYGNGCSATSAPVQVSVVPNPSAAVTASGPLTFCQGGSVTLVAPAGATYLWNNGAVTQSITATTSGAYSVVVSSNGCSTGSSVQQVTVLPTPPATVVASGALTFCVGGSVVLTAPAGYSYSWNTGATTASITATTSGTYSVLVSDGTCSATSSGTAVSAVPNNLNPQVFGVALAPINTVQSYFTSQNLGNGYTWVVSGGSVVSGQGTNAVTVFLGTAGNVKVVVVETNGFCNQSDTLTVKVSGLGSDEGAVPLMRVYPNPSNGNFTVETPSPGAALSVFDLLGRRIHHEVMSSDRLELDGIPAGLYVVRAEQGGTVWEERLVVQ